MCIRDRLCYEYYINSSSFAKLLLLPNLNVITLRIFMFLVMVINPWNILPISTTSLFLKIIQILRQFHKVIYPVPICYTVSIGDDPHIKAVSVASHTIVLQRSAKVALLFGSYP